MDAMYWVYTSRFNPPAADTKQLSPPPTPSPSPSPRTPRLSVGALLQSVLRFVS
jgi:hypothetical protein